MKKMLAIILSIGFFHLSAGENIGPCKCELQVTQLTQQNVDLVFDSEHPVVIDVYADWCGPCRQFAPIFEHAHRQYGAKYCFFKLDGDKNRDLLHSLRVTAFPTILYFVGGKEVGRHLGYMNKKEFAAELETYLGE